MRTRYRVSVVRARSNAVRVAVCSVDIAWYCWVARSKRSVSTASRATDWVASAVCCARDSRIADNRSSRRRNFSCRSSTRESVISLDGAACSGSTSPSPEVSVCVSLVLVEVLVRVLVLVRVPVLWLGCGYGCG